MKSTHKVLLISVNVFHGGNALNHIRVILKVKTSIGNAPISKNEMEALITNHVKEYVLTNT